MPHAFLLHLIPAAPAPPPRYPGRYAHGLFFGLLRHVNPDLAKTLHEAPRKPFTLTPFPRRNGEVVLRVTALNDALFTPFIEALLARAGEGLMLGDRAYRLARVTATPEGDALAGYVSWEALREAEPTDAVHLRFLKPTVFATSRPDRRVRYTPFPEPRLVLNSLLASWEAHSPYPYGERGAAALREVFALDAELGGFRDLRFHRVPAGKGFFPGFTGRVEIRLYSDSLEARAALGRLGALAFFSGVGAKTTYGMGLVVPGARFLA